MLVTITGGARSGKSRFAEQLAVHMAKQKGSAGYYIATAEAGDEEMAVRIHDHKERRKQTMPGFVTIEEPYDVAAAIQKISRQDEAENVRELPNRISSSTNHRRNNRSSVILVDCLTLWLSNWLLRPEHDQPQVHIQEKVTELIEAAAASTADILFVTNEVGDGLVPEYPLGRLYRDQAGWMNQQVAARSAKVFLVTAGIPLELKEHQYRISDDFPD